MKIRFNIGIVTAILLFITAMTAAVLTSVWVVSTNTAELSASSTFNGASGRARERVDRLMNEILVLANLGATQDDMTRFAGDGLEAPALPLMYTALSANPALYSLYFGFEDGRFLQVISPRDEQDVLTAHQVGHFVQCRAFDRHGCRFLHGCRPCRRYSGFHRFDDRREDFRLIAQ